MGIKAWLDTLYTKKQDKGAIILETHTHAHTCTDITTHTHTEGSISVVPELRS